MFRPIKNIVWSVLNRLGLGGSVQLYLESALKQYGWYKSFHDKQSVDASGNPLPWYTYSFIFFLEPRIKPHFEVFEYGSGNSTRWYGARVRRITAVEHDAQWIQIIRPQLPANAEVLSRELGESYIQAPKEKGARYQIIVVDGRNRVRCTEFASEYLTNDGVLILDNSERAFYQRAKDLMKERGFKRLDFQGMAPIVGHETCTTVFYREGNCLGI
ncbi:hypothetical protein DYBT9275_00755 [Dyadobacter sp. CECT 9275]|uniref:FkbM family methyltransferase n=1 Tax=Dyadobacter helix TaxID=2822344 RepID=A0A916N4G3_9BACT|nr:class I SAM-dependent methyltransferase [Dyadobacter sp. CECT 9275]CAG4991445.1 hypothetical protein DYBT9275_00755 [Dyadobacter sp. CECT 9275]